MTLFDSCDSLIAPNGDWSSPYATTTVSIDTLTKTEGTGSILAQIAEERAFASWLIKRPPGDQVWDLRLESIMRLRILPQGITRVAVSLITIAPDIGWLENIIGEFSLVENQWNVIEADLRYTNENRIVNLAYVRQLRLICATMIPSRWNVDWIETFQAPVTDTGNLGVHITSDGMPLPNVQVSNGIQSLLTDTEGNVFFSNLLPGTYEVSAVKNGYKTQSTSVVVEPNLTAEVTFELIQIVPEAPTKLHTEGKRILNEQGKEVLLRGVWKGPSFADSCTGVWGGDYFNWDESKVRNDMRNLALNWGVNVVNVLFWADWWIDDASTTLTGGTTNQPIRFCMRETARIAQDYGLYVQFRMYGSSAVQGRISGQPYPPYDNSGVFPDESTFATFWGDFALEFKDYPNVLFCLFDEPSGDMNQWFDAAQNAISAVRGAGSDQLIVIHLYSCGDCMWMEDWIAQGRPLSNILFSNHIYRYHGTFEWNSSSPTDIEYIRNYLARKNTQPQGTRPDGLGYLYISDTYDVPIWVSAIGAYNGATDDSEYDYFRNTLSVLNEWKFGYVAWTWRLGVPWTIVIDAAMNPNRVGQSLIDMIAKGYVPPTPITPIGMIALTAVPVALILWYFLKG